MERTFLGSINRAANIQPEVEIQLEIHDIYEERGDKWINIEKPTKAEIRLALKEQKNRKAPRIDNIPPEVLKEDLDVTIELLHPLCVKVWRTTVVPNDWKNGLLVKVPKKGDVTNCKNWRGITLLSGPSRIILNRIKICIEKRLQREQAGYQSKRSCIDKTIHYVSS
jgi:hypothetical protein